MPSTTRVSTSAPTPAATSSTWRASSSRCGSSAKASVLPPGAPRAGRARGELGLQPRQLLGGEPARPHRRGEEPVQVDLTVMSPASDGAGSSPSCGGCSCAARGQGAVFSRVAGVRYPRPRCRSRSSPPTGRARLGARAAPRGRRVRRVHQRLLRPPASRPRVLPRRRAALGDVLVVGLNGDASVRRLKGPGRPILAPRSASRC